jgi:hypothetical protein
MLLRFQKERASKLKRARMYNLDDDAGGAAAVRRGDAHDDDR